MMPDLKKIEEILKTNKFKTRIIQGADIVLQLNRGDSPTYLKK